MQNAAYQQKYQRCSQDHRQKEMPTPEDCEQIQPTRKIHTFPVEDTPRCRYLSAAVAHPADRPASGDSPPGKDRLPGREQHHLGTPTSDTASQLYIMAMSNLSGHQLSICTVQQPKELQRGLLPSFIPVMQEDMFDTS